MMIPDRARLTLLDRWELPMLRWKMVCTLNSQLSVNYMYIQYDHLSGAETVLAEEEDIGMVGELEKEAAELSNGVAALIAVIATSMVRSTSRISLMLSTYFSWAVLTPALMLVT